VNQHEEWKDMTSLQGVIWDMDGVLVDSGEFHYRAWVETLTEYGIEFSREDFQTTFGMNNEGILRMFLGERFTEDLYSEISDKKERNFRRAIRGKVKLLPGVLPLLRALKIANIPQAVGSSAPQENIDAIMRELNLGSYFQIVVSAASMPSKPDPTVFLTAARKLQAPADHCIVIEDAIAGVEAAHRGGMKCVAVTTTNTGVNLQSADRIVNRLDEISIGDLMALLDG
jgi:beta-phosphoglucomutase